MGFLGDVGGLVGGIVGSGKTGARKPYSYKTLKNIFKKPEWTDFPVETMRQFFNVYKTGQLPDPVQRALDTIKPMMQLQYSGTMDTASRTATSYADQLRRTLAEQGFTAPQMMQRQMQMEDALMAEELAARRKAAEGYQGALTSAWESVWNQMLNWPQTWYGIGGGMGQAPNPGMISAYAGIGRSAGGAVDSLLNAIPGIAGGGGVSGLLGG